LNDILEGTAMPVLHTARLDIRVVREDDLDACHRLYDDIGWSDRSLSEPARRERRRSWLGWSIANARELARLHQPPLGDRAVVDRATGGFVGMVGFVPALGPFAQLPRFGGRPVARQTSEIGLFWAVSPVWQRKGIATEAAAAMVAYAFDTLQLERIIATTEHDNHASQGVMRALGMSLERNPSRDPAYFQTVGVLFAGDRP
jgi:ribosomal-protein-alanine N-acetyltransferase